MNQDILLSKIVPNTTDTTWSQAYTTLNVYMTLSIENETSKTPVTSYGKEVLEKLQREFFALDNKSLDEIKKAVSNVIETIDKEYKYSIIIGAITKNVLYIVTASSGRVIIKRNGKVGTIAEGEENELIGFSGELKHNDIVVFATQDFAKKINEESLNEYLKSSDVVQIAENITPLIHEGSKGTEAAIIIQYKDLSSNDNKINPDDEIAEDKDSKEDIEDLKAEELRKDDEEVEEDELKENLWEKASVNENRSIEELEDETQDEEPLGKNQKSRFSFLPKINLANNKRLIGILIAILILILAGGIFYQVSQNQAAEKRAEFEKIYNPLNETLQNESTIEELEKALSEVDSQISNFPESSDEYKNLQKLKSDLENKINELKEASSAKNLQELIKAGSDLSSIDLVTFKGADIVIASKKDKKVAIVEDGEISDEFEVDDSINFVSSDNRFIYTLGKDGITQIDRGNGQTKLVAEDISGISFEVFSSNLYVLQEEDVRRFRSPSFQDTSYFTDSVDFKADPVSMSINGSIFVLEKGGVVESFNRGAREEFTLKNLPFELSDKTLIYTDGEYENIYILDSENQRVVSFNSEGDYKNQYQGNFIKGTVSFAVDEENKKCYIVSNNTLYSFDL